MLVTVTINKEKNGKKQINPPPTLWLNYNRGLP